jgi:lantibiotic transport system permease protein
MNLLVSLRSELLKTRRTASLYLCALTAGALPFIFLLDMCFGTLERDTLQYPWKAFFMHGLMGLCFVILPLYTIMVSTLLQQIEYRNGTWKQVLAAPQPKGRLYMAKFLVLQFYILLMLCSFILLMLASAGVAQLLRPDVVLFSQRSDWRQFFTTAGTTYTAILGISAFQLWLSMRFRNFIAPIGIGLALWLLAFMLLFEIKWVHADLFPYAYPALNIYPMATSSAAFLPLWSLGYAALFVGLGFLDFRRKIVKA